MEILHGSAGRSILRVLFNPFLLHTLLETPASLNFFIYPSSQTQTSSPQAHAVIRQYAVLLLSTVFIALVFAVRKPDELSGRVAGALALYHLAPMVRAMGRLGRGEQGWQPVLFLLVHGVCFAGLFGWCWDLYVCKLF
jgi:cell division protein FtsW (lipid II flippase)